jgi:competence protein ComEC
MMASPAGNSISLVGVKVRPLRLAVDMDWLANWRDFLVVETTQKFLWSPVLLLAGIFAYFSLTTEPTIGICAASCVAGISGLIFGRRYLVVQAVAVVLFGFGIAKVRELQVSTPLLRTSVHDVAIKGTIYDINFIGKSRATLLIDTESITDVSAEEMPRRVRLQATLKEVHPSIGDIAMLTADLRPLPRPASPRGFDYGRSLYFQSVGAVGYATKATFEVPEQIAFTYKTRRAFHSLRQELGARIRSVIDGPLGAFADALITGERAAIPKAMTESLQRSGLYHILSISGLHMSLVAGGVFFTIRALLAAIPFLALGYPIKKWAAVAALMVGLLYMMLADGGSATERSYIMIAIALFAVLVDRPAISLHNLALSALVIIVLQPEQAVDAGFQMSFLAVLGLAALFSWWQKHMTDRRKGRQSIVMQYSRKAIRGTLLSIATSFVAGNFSGLAAAYHFSRVSPFGIISNALALPAVGILVMPMALLSVVAMPFGLEAYPLQFMHYGLDVVMWISDWVAGWTGATINLARPAPQRALLIALSGALLCICVTRLRWLAVPIAASAIFFQSPDAPHILVEEQARNVAVLNGDGNYDAALPRASRFALASWARETGADIAKRKSSLWTCDSVTCATTTQSMSVVVLLRTAELKRPCPPADIIIAQYPLRHSCRGKRLTIDRFDVWKRGAHALMVTGGHISVATAAELRGSRPWAVEPRPRTVK